MQKVRIITDSASDIVDNKNPALTVLPMKIRFGQEEFSDGVDITHRQFYEKLLKCEDLPVTSLVSPADFEQAYKSATENGEAVVAITVSSKLSGTYQSAVLAAEDFEGSVFTVDSKSCALAEQVLVLYALELVEKGLCAKEIAEILEEEREKVHIIALLDTLEYLKRGGRISKTVAFVGGALAIKPVVTTKDGEVAMLGKARGSKNGNNFLIKEIESTSGIDFSKPLRLGYTGLDDTLLKNYIADSESLWRGHADSLKIATIGATIGTHIGPNAIAVAFFVK